MNQSIMSNSEVQNTLMMNNNNTTMMNNALQTNPDGSKTFQAGICLIIQSEREIAPWKKTAPMTTQELNSYIAVKLITRIHGIGTG
jgi:hypothetical protein